MGDDLKKVMSEVISEDQLQSSCFLWVHNNYPQLRGLLFHVPNGGNRNPREGNKLKAMGTIPGIPDLILIHPLTAFELKTSTGILSTDQKKIHAKWRDKGIDVHVIRSLDEFQRIVKSIINGSNAH